MPKFCVKQINNQCFLQYIKKDKLGLTTDFKYNASALENLILKNRGSTVDCCVRSNALKFTQTCDQMDCLEQCTETEVAEAVYTCRLYRHFAIPWPSRLPRVPWEKWCRTIVWTPITANIVAV